MSKRMNQLKSVLEQSLIFAFSSWMLPGDLQQALQTGEERAIHNAVVALGNTA